MENDDKREAVTLIGSVEDKDVIIVDDLVDTAGSIKEAVEIVKANGANDVYLSFAHPVLSGDGSRKVARVADQGDRLHRHYPAA